MTRNLIYLTEEELLQLSFIPEDEKTAKLIQEIKERRELESEEIPEKFRSFVAEAVRVAKENGKLTYRYTKLSKCPCCNTAMSYAKYKRNGKYHRKGQTDYSKPWYLSGIELAGKFISIVGSPTLGACNTCISEVKPYLAKALENIEAEIPQAITGKLPDYQYFDLRKCKKCGWIGGEHLMSYSRTLMGDGYFPCGCPNCGAENIIFGPTIIENYGGFVLVPLEDVPIKARKKNY